MQPHDDPEESAFRAEARAWLRAHAPGYRLPPVAPSAIVAEWAPADEERRLSEARAWQAEKYDAGWAGIGWPAAYGGRGGTPVQEVIFAQEEARFDVPHDALIVGLAWCGPALLVMGTEQQRTRFLPRLLRGDDLWCQLFSEPGAGSDLANLATRAEPDGEEWVLTGEKAWTTFAHHADWGLCIARHDTEAPRHGGLTAFAVDMRSPGVEVRPIRQMTGAANFNAVRLDGVRVPDAARIGAPGDGWRVVVTTFMFERIGAMPGGLGAVDALRRLIQDRAVGGDPLTRDRFVRVYIADRILHFLGMRMLTASAKAHVPGPEGSVGKLLATRALTDLFEEAERLLGADGMLVGADAPRRGEWQAGFLGAPGLRIGGGTDQIQRNIIGERLLGLERDPR